VEWAVNINHTDFWLNGLYSITLRDVKGFFSRWYNKKGLNVCRQEVHSTVPLRLEEVINYLKGKTVLGIPDLRDKIDVLHEGIKTLSNDNKRLKAMLTRFVEVLHDLSPQPTVLTYDIRKEYQKGKER
jgi:hypothetical protein